MCSPHHETPSQLHPHLIPLCCPRTLALGALLHASDLHWSSILHMVMYTFQCYSLKSSHPHLLPLSPKVWHSVSNVLYFRSGISWWLSGKASVCNVGDACLVPGSGRSFGGGHGNPFQYSCLENPMDRGTWRATVHKVIKNWTRLKSLSTHACTYFGSKHMWIYKKKLSKNNHLAQCLKVEGKLMIIHLLLLYFKTG